MKEINPPLPASADNLRARLQQEAGVLDWSELARHFARGVVIMVAPEIVLLDAAERIASDDSEQLQRWLDSGELKRAADDDARQWNARAPSFDCVVVAPWVLVQEHAEGQASR